MKSRFLTTLNALLIAALALLPFSIPLERALAAATTQTTHAFLCAPQSAVGTPGPRRVVNTSSTASPQPAYSLNGEGCAVIASADIGFFLSQGYTYGPNIFTLQQAGITASTTSTTSTITLPAYGYLLAIVLEETSGAAITGGIDIGDATSATTFASGISLGANGNVAVSDVGFKARFVPATGNAVSDQILVACHTSCNSGSVNITLLFTYF